MIRGQQPLYAIAGDKPMNDQILLFESMAQVRSVYETRAVDATITHKFRGNFYGLLRHLGISPKYYFICMYLNEIKNPFEFDGQAILLKIPYQIKIRT